MAKSLLNDDGTRLVHLHSGRFPGRELTCIIDEQGRVFKPNPYDMSKDPYRVLAFALNHILAMMESGRMPANRIGPFITEEESIKYRVMTEDVLHGLDAFLISKKVNTIDYQGQSLITEEEIKKFEEEMKKKKEKR